MHTYSSSAACRGSRTGVNKYDSFELVSQVKTISKDYLNQWHTDLRALAHPSDTVASSFVIPEGLHSMEGPGQGYLAWGRMSALCLDVPGVKGDAGDRSSETEHHVAVYDWSFDLG